MKSKFCAYIISLNSLFNKDKIECFESFDKKNTIYLNLSLLLNHLEILQEISENISFYFCLDEKDRNFTSELSQFNENIIWSSSKDLLFKILSEKYFNNFEKNIIIPVNSIGFSKEDILKTFNLLSTEEETVVLGKTLKENLSFLGFNKFYPEIFSKSLFTDLNYDSFLKAVFVIDNFIYILGNFMLIRNLEDFKNLYHELSNKESFSYCSEKNHERFTNLFIEYKELLK